MREEHANEINKIRRKLEESEKARAALKDDIQDLNDNIVVFEEELFESKNIQLNLLD